MTTLKQFVNEKGFLYDNDFELIKNWILSNSYKETKHLVKMLYELSEKQLEEYSNYKDIVREYTTSSFNILGDNVEKKDASVAINLIKLAYLNSYDDECFKIKVDDILKNFNFDIEVMRSNERIYNRYKLQQ